MFECKAPVTRSWTNGFVLDAGGRAVRVGLAVFLLGFDLDRVEQKMSENLRECRDRLNRGMLKQSLRDNTDICGTMDIPLSKC